MTSQSEPTLVSELLGSALAESLGAATGEPATIEDLTRLSGGASRETWSFRAHGGSSEPMELILRRDPPGRPGPPNAMRNEADAIRACTKAGLAVPVVLHASTGDELGTDGMVMSRVEGETIARRILRDDEFATARTVLTEQVAEFMAGLHAIDPAEVPGAGETDDLGTYRFAYEFVEDRSPTFAATLEWLDANKPERGRTTLVHGDLRMGNVIVDRNGLAAVIDWELMHIGDPIEDLAWFCVKAWRFGSPLGAGGVGEIEDLIGHYERLAGVSVDRDVFHWWLVEKTLVWGIICMGQAFAHLSGAVRSHELAAIGRRVAEVEWDLIELLAPDAARTVTSTPTPDPGPDDPGIFGRPTAREILDAVRGFLTHDVMESTSGRMSFNARVASNMLAIVERELAVDPGAIGSGYSEEPSWDELARLVHIKLMVANPKYLDPAE